MTWNEYSDYYRLQHERDIELEDENLRLLIERDNALTNISKNARKAIGIPDDKDMRETRRTEKDRVNFKGAVSNYIEGSNWVRGESKLFKQSDKSISDIMLGDDGTSVTEGKPEEQKEVLSGGNPSPCLNSTDDENKQNSTETVDNPQIALLSDEVPEAFRKRRHSKF